MKSNKYNLKKTISLMLYIFLILSVEIESTYKSISLAKYRNRAIKSSLKRNSNKVVAPFNNPLMNLLAGIKNIFFPSENGNEFYKCFPEKFLAKDTSPKVRNGYFDKYTSFLQFLGRKIIQFFPSGSIMDFICSNREMILSKIKTFLPMRKRREYSENFESEKNKKNKKSEKSYEKSYGKLNKRNKYVRKFRTEWLFSAVSSVFNATNSVLKAAGNTIMKGLEWIKNQALKIFNAAKNFIVNVVKGLVTFFKDVLYTFVNCFLMNKALFLGSAFAIIVVKLSKKFKNFMSSMGAGIGLIFLANEFLGYLCMKKENEITNKLLSDAFKTKDDNKKALLMGEGLANMLKTFANSQ